MEPRRLGAGGDEGCGGKRAAERAGETGSGRAGAAPRASAAPQATAPLRLPRSLGAALAPRHFTRDPAGSLPPAKATARGRPRWLMGAFLAASPLLPCGRRPRARRVVATARQHRFSRGGLLGRRGAEGAARGSSVSPAGEWSGRPDQGPGSGGE